MSIERRIKSFNDTYGAKLTIEFIDNTVEKKLSMVNELIFEQKTLKSDKEVYLRNLTDVVLNCINDRLKINADSVYTLDNLDIPALIREFDDIVQQRKDETEYDKQRSPYEGYDYRQVVKHVMKQTEKFNVSLSKLWCNNILNETLSIKDLRAVTDGAIQNIKEMKEGGYNDTYKPAVTNVLAALEALEYVREQRGFWWKLFNFRINSREKAYLNELRMTYTSIVLKDVKTSPIYEESIWPSKMTKVQTDVAQHLKRVKMKEASKNAQISKDKTTKVSQVNESLKERFIDESLSAKVQNAIIEKLPSCRLTKDEQRVTAMIIIPSMIKIVQPLNEKFDEDISIYGSRKLMINMVKGVFQQAYGLVSGLGYMTDDKRLVATQIMTDEILKNYSPVALDDKFAEFADGYVLKHPNEFVSVTGLNADAPDMVTAATSFEDLQRNSVQIVELNPTKTETVPPVKTTNKDALSIIKNN